MRKKRPEPTFDAHVCVCPFIIMFVCAWSYCSYFFCCLSVRSSAPLSVYLSISPGPLCICAEFGQHLRSVLCAWFVFLSSGSESIPLSESECQLCEAKLSQILWNQLNMHQGLMQIKWMPLCSTRHFIVLLNRITVPSFSHTQSFIHSFSVWRAKERPWCRVRFCSTSCGCWRNFLIKSFFYDSF